MTREAELDKLFASEGPSFGSAPTPYLLEAVKEAGVRGRALDLGSGDGRDALHLARLGYDVTAVDLSSVALRKLQRIAEADGIAERVHCVHADIASYPTPPDEFQLAIAVTSLDHLADAEGISALNRLQASVAPGGLLFVRVHTVDDPGFSNDDQSSETKGVIRNYYRRGGLLALLRKDFRLIRYTEEREDDFDHGAPHFHYFSTLIAKRL